MKCLKWGMIYEYSLDHAAWPRTQSWCFVPLLYSALGRVPANLAGDAISTPEQIEILGGLGAGLCGDLGEDA